METTQATLIELLRQVHTLAIKEIDRLNMRIAELEKIAARPTPIAAAPAPVKAERPSRPVPEERPASKDIALLNEHQVAAYICLSVASIRRWRLLRQGPQFLKIGASVRYRREDLEAWLNSTRKPC
jgi:predicted DNA-binding transcriptional regulator AlpA